MCNVLATMIVGMFVLVAGGVAFAGERGKDSGDHEKYPAAAVSRAEATNTGTIAGPSTPPCVRDALRHLQEFRMPMSVRLLLAVALVAGLGLQTIVAQPARGLGVAVVDFYAPNPLPPVEGVIPEELAADDLSSLLTKAAGPQITVLSRGAVRQAEAAIVWRGSDTLRFGRLQQLARALNADRVVIGWIERLDLDEGGWGGPGAGVGRHFLSGFATVTVQVFDPKQGRIMFQVQESAYEIGVVRGRVAEGLLRRVLERAVPSLVRVL